MKNSLKHSTYEYIKNKIIHCEYEPGMFLNEELLCSEIGVSRTPVRDALSRLEQEGLINILPKKGIMISNLSINDMNMTYEFRLMLEPYILQHYGPFLDSEKLLYYYHLFSDHKLLEDKELSSTADDEFHIWIVNSCRIPTLKTVTLPFTTRTCVTEPYLESVPERRLLMSRATICRFSANV